MDVDTIILFLAYGPHVSMPKFIPSYANAIPRIAKEKPKPIVPWNLIVIQCKVCSKIECKENYQSPNGVHLINMLRKRKNSKV
jgi:hypothetical protein